MVAKARILIKKVLSEFKILDLDIKNEINSSGNYLVFDSLNKTSVLKADLVFSIYIAKKVLKKDSAIDELLDNISKTIIDYECNNENDISCLKIELHSFDKGLFIYKMQIQVKGEIDEL